MASVVTSVISLRCASRSESDSFAFTRSLLRVWSVPAILLNESASTPNSSLDFTGIRTLRSPIAIERVPSTSLWIGLVRARAAIMAPMIASTAKYPMVSRVACRMSLMLVSANPCAPASRAANCRLSRTTNMTAPVNASKKASAPRMSRVLNWFNKVRILSIGETSYDFMETLLVIEFCDSLTDSIERHLCAICHMQLIENMADVSSHCAFADHEFFRDVIIGKPLCDQAKHFHFTLGQRVSCRWQTRRLVEFPHQLARNGGVQRCLTLMNIPNRL